MSVCPSLHWLALVRLRIGARFSLCGLDTVYNEPPWPDWSSPSGGLASSSMWGLTQEAFTDRNLGTGSSEIIRNLFQLAGHGPLIVWKLSLSSLCTEWSRCLPYS